MATAPANEMESLAGIVWNLDPALANVALGKKLFNSKINTSRSYIAASGVFIIGSIRETNSLDMPLTMISSHCVQDILPVFLKCKIILNIHKVQWVILLVVLTRP